MRSPLLQLAGLTAGVATHGFRRSLTDCDASQGQVKKRLGKALMQTALGRHDGVTTPSGFDAIPPRTWAELRPWAERAASGEAGVLSPHPTLFTETTSGSSGSNKSIAYTRPLRSAFTRMFLIWAHDVLTSSLPLRSGKMFMSVSPHLVDEPGSLSSGPVGDDTDFLDGWVRPLVRRFLVVPPGTSRPMTPGQFHDAVARCLLDAPDLEMISVWNPTFLTIALEHMASDRARYSARLTGSRRDAFLAHDPDWSGVWPSLRFLSCWADAHAGPHATRLKQLFPGALVQGKGLLATEGPVTVPLVQAPAPVPLVDRVLVEFLDKQGDLLTLSQVREGQEYELVVSFPGGLPRYRLGDRVAVAGRYLDVPCLRFVGRVGGVSDLVGEKLHPDMVRDVLHRLAPGVPFRMLVAMRQPQPHYVLLLERAPQDEDQLERRLDEELFEAHHYALARRLRQLGAPRVMIDPSLPGRYLRAAATGGARVGDVKHRFLWSRPGDDWLAERAR